MISGSSALIQAIDSKTLAGFESYLDEAKHELENSQEMLQEGFLYAAEKKPSEIVKLFLTKFPALDTRSLIKKALKKALQKDNCSALSYLLTSKHLNELDREYYQVLSPAETDALMAAASSTNTSDSKLNLELESLIVNLNNAMLSETSTQLGRQRSAIHPPEVVKEGLNPAVTIAKDRETAESFTRKRALANAVELTRMGNDSKSNELNKCLF